MRKYLFLALLCCAQLVSAKCWVQTDVFKLGEHYFYSMPTSGLTWKEPVKLNDGNWRVHTTGDSYKNGDGGSHLSLYLICESQEELLAWQEAYDKGYTDPAVLEHNILKAADKSDNNEKIIQQLVEEVSGLRQQVSDLSSAGTIEKAVKEEIANTDVIKQALVEEVAGNSTVLREEVKATIAQERAEKLAVPLAENQMFIKNLDVTKLDGMPIVKIFGFTGSDKQPKSFDCGLSQDYLVLDMSEDKIKTNNANAVLSYLLTKYAAGDAVTVLTKAASVGDSMVCSISSVS